MSAVSPRLGLTLFVSLAAGCAVGPDYHPPVVPVASSPSAFVELSRHSTPTPVPDAWWALYESTELDRLVRAAIAANTDLRVASANLLAARALLDEARAGRLPTTALSSGAAYGIDAGALAAAAGRGRPTPSWTFEAGLDVSWELDLFGRITRSIEAADADVGVAEAARDAVRVSVVAETTRAYADICSFGAAVEVQERSIAIAERGATLTRDQFAAGAVGNLEVRRSGALVAQTRAALPPLEAQRRGALYRLALFTGRAPESDPGATASCRRAPALRKPLPVGDGAAMLRRRPDIRQAERQVAAASARIGIATADLYPTVSLGGSITGVGANVGRLFDRDHRTWSVGPVLTWTFPNVSSARARIRNADALYVASIATFDGTVLAALNDIEQALATEAAELDRHEALMQARDDDAEALSLSETQYRAGAIGFLELLDVQRTLIADDLALAQSDQLLAADQILVFKALAGGWASDDPSSLPIAD